MNILPNIRQKINREILPQIPKKMSGLFTFGVNVLSLVPFSSLNQNARVFGAGQSQKADLMRIFRLTRNEKLIWSFYHLLSQLDQLKIKLTNDSLVNIDLTILAPFAVLCFSLQTREGRAIPVFIDLIKYPIKEKNSQNLFIINSLRKFLMLINHGHSEFKLKPKIVCDRGFMGENLISRFSSLGLIFYVRVKKSIFQTTVIDRRQLDNQIIYHQLSLRLVRSGRKLKSVTQSREEWYLLTNDLSSSRNIILGIYYHRFEIEEVFKDLKHLFQTKQCFIKSTQTLRIIIWFQILGLWLLWAVKTLKSRPNFSIHPHQQLSWVKQFWEALQSELYQPLIRIRWLTS